MVEPVSSADRGLALGIFAPGGIGKTTLAATITDSEHAPRALVLNARGNPHVISSYGAAGKIDVANYEKFVQQEALRQDILKAGLDFPYQTVILDNITEMWSRRLAELYGPVADIDWTKHSASTADVLQLVRNWMDMAETGSKLNVIFIFQETPEARVIRGQKIESRSEIAANKALQSQIPTIINFLGRLYIDDDTPPFRRVLDFTPIETMHQAKFQVDPKDEVTRSVPMMQYNPHLGHLLDTIRYREPWPAELHDKKAKP